MATEVMMVEPPGDPSTMKSLPSLSKIVGVIELSIRFPGCIELASPPIRPYELGKPGLILKSSIWLFRIIPVPGITILDP